MGNEAESLPLLASRPVRARRTKQVTADDVMVLLRERYSAPEYAFMGQVRSATGYRRTIRTADGKKHTGIDLMEAERQYEIGSIADAVKFVRDSQALGYGHVGRLIDLAKHAEKSGGVLREYLTGAGLWKASDAE